MFAYLHKTHGEINEGGTEYEAFKYPISNTMEYTRTYNTNIRSIVPQEYHRLLENLANYIMALGKTVSEEIQTPGSGKYMDHQTHIGYR